MSVGKKIALGSALGILGLLQGYKLMQERVDKPSATAVAAVATVEKPKIASLVVPEAVLEKTETARPALDPGKVSKKLAGLSDQQLVTQSEAIARFVTQHDLIARQNAGRNSPEEQKLLGKLMYKRALIEKTLLSRELSKIQ